MAHPGYSPALRQMWSRALETCTGVRRLTMSTCKHHQRLIQPIITLPSRCLSFSTFSASSSSSTFSSTSSSSSASTDDIDEVLGGSLINWYPGHMHKTFHALEQRVKQAHIVLEIRDARLPFSSANPKLDEVIGAKRRVIVFNKADLTPPHSLDGVIDFYQKRGQPALLTHGHSSVNVKRILPLVESMVNRKFGTLPLNVLVVGYPNVGKSSIINNLRSLSLRRAGPRVAPTPGYTRHISGYLISTTPPLFLLDTPGVMIPSFTPTPHGQSTALRLALIRAFKDTLIDTEVMGRYLVRVLKGMGVGWEGLDGMVEEVGGRIEGVGDGEGSGVRERVVRFMLRKFRRGEMGLVMLDDVEEEMARLVSEEKEKEELKRLRKERKEEEELIRTGKARRVHIVTLGEATAPNEAQR